MQASETLGARPAPLSPEPLHRLSRRIGETPSVFELTGLSRSVIYDLIKKGEFPPGIKVGRSRVWPASQIAEWQRKMMEAQA